MRVKDIIKIIDEVLDKLSGYEDYSFSVKTEDVYTSSITNNYLEELSTCFDERADEDCYLIPDFNIDIDKDSRKVTLTIYEVYHDVYNEDDPADAWFFED